MSIESNTNDCIVIGHHATTARQADDILKDQYFKHNEFNDKVLNYKKNQKTKMPNDLGNGAYFFIEDEKFGISSKEVAKEYYKKVKQKSRKYDGQIIKVNIDVSEKYNELNFNEMRNIKTFNLYKKNNMNRINKIFDDFIEINSTYNRAKSQRLVDGLAIEMMIFEIERRNQKVDYLYFDTQIEVNSFKTRINNAREMCVRNQNMILSIERGD